MDGNAYEILSLDLWDTVIRRKCHPDAIKQKTSEYFLLDYFEYVLPEFRTIQKLTEKRISCERTLGENLRQEGKDDEYEIHDVFRLWISQAAPNLPDSEKKIQEFYDAELKSEIENDYLDPTIVSEVQKHQYKNLAYVSDFYAGTEFIDAILKAVGCPLVFTKKFISCECGFNKRSGRLFDYVLAECGISPSQQLHIGDNQYSDVKCPVSKGIDAVHYLPEKEHSLRLSREKEFNATAGGHPLRIPYGRLDSDGRTSIFFYGFICWVLDLCKKDSIRKIYFFTREGEFFKEIYDEVIKAAPSKAFPVSEILEVSRIATFCPSLREISLRELMRIWNQYSVQPLSALFKSLSVKKESVIQYLERFHIDWNEVITYPWQDGRVISLFNDEDFLSAMEKIRVEKKSLILEYFAGKNLLQGTNEKIAIVDIGWRGTIQDNIAYLFPNTEIKGFYIALQGFLNEQPKNVTKIGYINGFKNLAPLLNFVSPFEMLCNSPNGSTVGYERQDGKICAVRKKEAEEDAVFYECTEKMQKAILSDIPILEKELGKIPYISSELRSESYETLFEFITNPTKRIADAYFSLKHNEEFGVGEYIDKTTSFPLLLFVKAIFSKKWRKRFSDFFTHSGWPQGYFAKYHLRPLIRRYNRKIFR